jgi:hypothetical protein
MATRWLPLVVALALLWGCTRLPGVELARVSPESVSSLPQARAPDGGEALWSRTLALVPPDAIAISVTDLERLERRPSYGSEIPLSVDELELVEGCVSTDEVRLVAKAYNAKGGRLVLVAGAGVVAPGNDACVAQVASKTWLMTVWAGGTIGNVLAITNEKWRDVVERRTLADHPQPLHRATAQTPMHVGEWQYASRRGNRGWPLFLRDVDEIFVATQAGEDLVVRVTLGLRPRARSERLFERIARKFANSGGPLIMMNVPNHSHDRIEAALGPDTLDLVWTASPTTVKTWKDVRLR